MLSAIIIDDEKKGRLALKQKLQDYCPEIQIIHEADNGEAGILLIEKHLPHIVFLDIEMPRMDGFAMLHRLAEKNFHLIFTTAYDQYAIKAIRYSAFDYLLKPVDIEELKFAISRIAGQSTDLTAKKLVALEQNVLGKGPFNKIAIPSLSGISFFDISDIIHLEASSNYTTLHFRNHASLIVSKTLKEFEELLPADIFFRPHHSHLINLNYIRHYIKGDGGQVEMQNGNLVDISRRKKESFLKIIRS
jgi:two-component system LytT family response regulator